MLEPFQGVWIPEAQLVDLRARLAQHDLPPPRRTTAGMTAPIPPIWPRSSPSGTTATIGALRKKSSTAFTIIVSRSIGPAFTWSSKRATVQLLCRSSYAMAIPIAFTASTSLSLGSPTPQHSAAIQRTPSMSLCPIFPVSASQKPVRKRAAPLDSAISCTG